MATSSREGGGAGGGCRWHPRKHRPHARVTRSSSQLQGASCPELKPRSSSYALRNEWFGGILCCGAGLGANGHPRMSWQPQLCLPWLGWRWHPQDAGTCPWGPSSHPPPSPRMRVLWGLRDPRVALPPLRGTLKPSSCHQGFSLGSHLLRKAWKHHLETPKRLGTQLWLPSEGSGWAAGTAGPTGRSWMGPGGASPTVPARPHGCPHTSQSCRLGCEGLMGGQTDK